MSYLFTKETKINKGDVISDYFTTNRVNTHIETISIMKCDENYKQYLEVKYVECLKKSYIKKEILENKCDLYIKEYMKCLGEINSC